MLETSLENKGRDVEPAFRQALRALRSDLRVNRALIDINREKIQTGPRTFRISSERTDENENHRA
jgi:hypothetical protein